MYTRLYHRVCCIYQEKGIRGSLFRYVWFFLLKFIAATSAKASGMCLTAGRKKKTKQHKYLLMMVKKSQRFYHI